MINDGYIISQMSTIPNRIVTVSDKRVFLIISSYMTCTHTPSVIIARNNCNMHQLATNIVGHYHRLAGAIYLAGLRTTVHIPCRGFEEEIIIYNESKTNNRVRRDGTIHNGTAFYMSV